MGLCCSYLNLLLMRLVAVASVGQNARKAYAPANGLKFGRKPKAFALSARRGDQASGADGETLASIAQSYVVDLSMISRL